MGKKIVLNNKTYDVSKMSLKETIKFSVLVSYKGSITEENMSLVHSELIEKFPRNFFNSKSEEPKESENIESSEESKEPEEPKESENIESFEESKEPEEHKEITPSEMNENYSPSNSHSSPLPKEDYSDRDLELEIENDLQELKEMEYIMDLKSMNSSKLKQICKSKGLKKYSKFKKEELIELILKHYRENLVENIIDDKQEGEQKDDLKDLKDMNTKNLKDLCKSRGLKNYSKLKKDELIKLLNNAEYKIKENEQEVKIEQDEQDENYLKSLNCSKLKEICKSKGFKKFSKFSKEKLIEFILNDGELKETEITDNDEIKVYDRDTLNNMNTEKLKKICKSKGLKKFSKLKKEELIELISLNLNIE
jgi:hypothetical protein